MKIKRSSRFEVKVSKYIEDKKDKSSAFAKMYYDHDGEVDVDIDNDILLEKHYSQVKGLVYKFPRRVLVLLTFTCLSNCRYCERQGRVGVGRDTENHLNNHEIDQIVKFIAEHQEINEVIVSGGDPLMHIDGLEYLTKHLSKNKRIKIFRIKTRVPMQDPSRVDYKILEDITHRFETVYLSFHIDHPDEFTPESEKSIIRIRKMGYILLGQSIFLKGLNDDEKILSLLFTRMSELGIRPYYIYHCQTLPGTKRFVMNIEDEREIMSRLREKLSGIAFPMHVIDMQNTTGKVIVPTNHWNTEIQVARNYFNELFDLKTYTHRNI